MSCQLLGGHLVEVETAEEAAHLKQLCQNKGRVEESGMCKLERFRLFVLKVTK